MDKMKILVVDDNTVNLALVEQELQDKYEVIPVISGRRAINYLYRERVDLVLLDVQMPIMDGIETLREIRRLENGITVPVCFLTARKERSTVIAGSKLGIMDYILKPFDSNDLSKRIELIFKKMGKIPMEDHELLNQLIETKEIIEQKDYSKASEIIESILGYKIEKEVRERIRHVKVRIDEGDYESAHNMIMRVIKYMEKLCSSEVNDEEKLPISEGEINVKLLYILDDLENFKMKEVTTKLNNLLKYDMPEDIYKTVMEAKKKIEEYDDGTAEIMIKNLLEEIRNPKKKKVEDNGYKYLKQKQ